MKIKVRIILFCSSIFLLVVTCGLEESIPVLSKPLYAGINDIDDTFQFRITENNGCTECEAKEPDFLGFEIYYRFFYYNSTSPTQPGHTGHKTVSDLESNSFKRISYYIDDDDCDTPSRILKPLIPIPKVNRGCKSLITINFGVNSDVHIKAQNEETDSGKEGISKIREQAKLEIRRNITDQDNVGYFKSFEDFKATDTDVAGLNFSSLTEDVYIVLYVFSFGRYNISETIYSEVLYLGTITLTKITVLE